LARRNPSAHYYTTFFLPVNKKVCLLKEMLLRGPYKFALTVQEGYARIEK